MKKKIAILLILAVMLCGLPALAEGGFEPAATYDPGERSFNWGPVTLTPASQAGGTVDTVRYPGVEGADYTDEKVYTYNAFVTATVNMDWNPHTWEMSDDEAVLSMITSGFYEFYMNEDRTGYAILPEMAADYPVDVTDQYTGRFGVKEGETAKAWRIPLNPDARWNLTDTARDYLKSTGIDPDQLDMTITADDYLYSMRQQLNPKMLNRRADSYYAGNLKLYNAKNYLYGGKTTYDKIEDSAEDLLNQGKELYLDMDFWGLTGALDADGAAAPRYVSIADENAYRDASVEDEKDAEAWVSAKYLFDNYLAAGQSYENYQGEYLYTADIAPETRWEDVGLVKIDDYTIDLILDMPMQEAAFNLPYSLGSPWLVFEPLYEACKSCFDAEGRAVASEAEAASVTTDYCRSLEKTAAFGPYNLTYFEQDKQYTFGRNPDWYGYHDGKHLGLYQTDNYSVTVIPEHATQLLAFLSGQVDGVGLQPEDMEKYASSEFITYAPQSYTTKVTFNTDYEKLLSRGTNSQVLAVDEFREAFALAIDRQHFASAYTAACTPGFGLLNHCYVYNPFSGGIYRESEPARRAMAELYGATWGEGGEYATLDEATEALTGYDMNRARELMQTAYQKAVDAKIYDGQSPIIIDFRVFQSDTLYVQMFTYLDQQLRAACEGTGFEGKVSLTMTVDPDYYQSNYSGNTDVIFSTWGGADMNPFSLPAQCYTDAADGSGQQMEYGFDTAAVALTFNCNGEDLTASLHDWSLWLSGQKLPALDEKLGAYSDYSYDTRCAFLAGVEECLLRWHATTPIYYRYSASLHSRKISPGSPVYINNIVGTGGLPYTTYHYDDEGWSQYIAQNELAY